MLGGRTEHHLHRAKIHKTSIVTNDSQQSRIHLLTSMPLLCWGLMTGGDCCIAKCWTLRYASNHSTSVREASAEAAAFPCELW
jgi:hypothetical protein